MRPRWEAAWRVPIEDREEEALRVSSFMWVIRLWHIFEVPSEGTAPVREPDSTGLAAASYTTGGKKA